MILPQLRLQASGGNTVFWPHPVTSFYFLDYDTRKWLLFQGPMDPYYSGEWDEVAMKVLLPVIDQLEDDVTKITFSADGKSWKATNSPDDDVTPFVFYPRFTEAEVGDLATVTLKWGMLEEIDRLAIGVDLVRTRPAGAGARSRKKLFAFRYNLMPKVVLEQSMWTGAFLHRAVGTHPNVVPFGDFVVDGSPQRLVGYTTEYVSGASLERRNLPVFKRAWIKQLTELIDLLNLSYGLLHQDVVPKNLVFDDKKDRILLLDFGNSALHGSKFVRKGTSDVVFLCFTVYELLTGDREAGRDYYAKDLHSIMGPAKPWPLKKTTELERGVSTDMIKQDLNEWVRERRTAEPSTFELQSWIYCPEWNDDRSIAGPPREKNFNSRGPPDFIKHVDPNAHIFRWERPASAHLRSRKSSRIRAQKG